MPQNTVFYIDDVCIPVSWYTIDAGRNNKLYVSIDGVNHSIEIPSGNYTVTTLNTAIVDAMNNLPLSQDDFVADPQTATNRVSIKVTSTRAFQLLTDDNAISAGFSAPLQSMNDVLRNYTQQINLNGSPYISGYVDLFPIRNIYITSPNLGNFNTMSVWGD